ncbi:hypothetical protein WR25_00651 isoform B [Diploscapter pachys]|nr:hypothetical protein WR25_00651 isoform B [Diploscapter pachys]
MNKEQFEWAKYVRFNTPTQQTKFEGNDVHYFTGREAVDTLFDSKYGTKAKGTPRFQNRQQVVDFMKEMLVNKCFFRVRKLVPRKKEEPAPGGGDKKSPRKDKESKKTADEATETEVDDKEKDKKEEEKKKKKIKLEVHNTQVFNDDKDVYVWVFDPTPFWKKCVGLLILVGCIAGCLFPLWPIWLRQGVYYVSLAGIFAFCLLIAVAIIRTIIFGAIWAATMGRHNLWILPNLTEDCGFFESFKPFYTYEYCPPGEKKDKKKDKKKKAKDSDDEKENEEENENENGAEDVPEPSKGSKNASQEGSARNTDDEFSMGSATESEQLSTEPPSPEQKLTKRRKAKLR